MPKQTRYAIKRKLSMVDGHIVNAQNGLAEVGSLYEIVHPEIYETFVLATTALEQVRQVVERQSNDI